MIQTLIKAGISIGSLVVIILLAQAYHDSLFERSLTLIPELQKDLSENGKTAWNLTSDFIFYSVSVLPLALAYIRLETRPRCIYYFLLSHGVFAIANILKLNLHQARPYWESSEIDAVNCSG